MIGASSTIMQPPSRARIAQLLLLTMATSSANFARTSLGPLQESIRLDLGLTDNQMALLQGPAIALPLLLGAIPLGLLIDRYSRSRLLLVFALGNLLGTALAAIGSGFLALLFARCLVGISAAAISITTVSVLADLYRPSHRGRASMVMAMGEIGGAALAFTLGGILLATFVWEDALMWMTIPLTLVAGCMLGLHDPLRVGEATERLSPAQSMSLFWQNRRIMAPLLIGKVMIVTGSGAVTIWAAPTLARNHGLAPDRIGAIMGICLLLSGIVGSLAGGVLADLCQKAGGPKRTMAVLSALSLVAVGGGMFGVIADTNLAILLLFFFKSVVLISGVAEMMVCTIVVPAELRGLCLSILIASGLIFGIGVAPLTVSLIADVTGGPSTIGHALAIVCVTTSLIGALVFAFASRIFPGKESAS